MISKLAYVFLWFEILQAFSQDMPSIACPDKFQYRNSGNKYFGKITIYGAPVPAIKVEAQFSQREPIKAGSNDRLRLIESLRTTEANLQHGFPITFRAEFPDPYLMPKLERIRVNDRTICTDNDFKAPNATFTLHFTFYPSLKTLSRRIFSTRLIDPFKLSTAIAFYPDFNQTWEPADATNDVSYCGQVDSIQTSPNLVDHDVERGSFPWLAAIFGRKSVEPEYVCSGFLISTRTVITSVRCFHNKEWQLEQLVVYLGRNDLTYLETGVEAHGVQALIMHPDFQSYNSDADIALVHLKTPTNFTQFIRPICLWSSTEISPPQVGYHVGWGVNNAFYMTHVPKVYQINTISEVECLRSHYLFSNWTSPRTLCAGYLKGIAPCFRTAGSGLMMKNSAGNWELRAMFAQFIMMQTEIGIICHFKKPAVYCDLSQHMTWIRQNMLQ